MKYAKYLTGFALAVGLLAAGTTTASAQDWRGRFDARQDFRQDMRQDNRRIAEMREHIARDRARLNEDMRRGRQRAAARDAADLARDERALHAMMRDARFGNGWR
jgi:hypothetical protein